MRKNLKKILVGILGLALVLGMFWGLSVLTAPKQLHALPTGGNDNVDANIVTATGIGKISLEPDIAYLNLGVESEDKNAAKASADNAACMDAILKAVKAAGVKEQDIQTNDYNIQPQYDYSRNKPVFNGYKVTHYIKIKVTEIDKASTILDKAVQAGANLVSNVSFDVADRGQVYQQALETAVKDAKLKAETMVKAGDVTGALKLYRVSEAYYSAKPIYDPSPMKDAMAEEAMDTSISTGIMEVTAQVQVTFTWE